MPWVLLVLRLTAGVLLLCCCCCLQFAAGSDGNYTITYNKTKPSVANTSDPILACGSAVYVIDQVGAVLGWVAGGGVRLRVPGVMMRRVKDTQTISANQGFAAVFALLACENIVQPKDCQWVTVVPACLPAARHLLT
jgi:hypothetical protein